MLLGKNPLCAEGSACEQTEYIYNEDDGTNSNDPLMDANLGEMPTLTIGGIEFTGDSLDFGLIFNNPDAIRQLLVEGGVGEEMINQLTDEQLLELTAGLRETAEQAQQAQSELIDVYNFGGLSGNSSPNSPVSSEDNQQNTEETGTSGLDVDYIRKMLVEGGIPKEFLNNISDEEILNYFNEMQAGI